MIEFMSGRDAFSLVRKAGSILPCDVVFSEPELIRYGRARKLGPVYINPNLTINEGTVYDDNYCHVYFEVGVKEFVETPDKQYSVETALQPVVNMFHEVGGHGGQIMTEFDKNCPLSKALAVNYYACRSSNLYYGYFDGAQPFDSYYQQPHEIAAQYMGVKLAYEFLSVQYGEKDANAMMCKYVNHRFDIGSEFMKTSKRYSDVHEVLSDFDKEFKKQVFAHRDYDYKRQNGELIRYDALYQYGSHRGQGVQFCSRVAACPSGLKQDMIMAGAYCEEHNKNGFILSRPCFQGLSMSVESNMKLLKPAMKPMPAKASLCLHDLSGLDVLSESGNAQIRGPDY